jgi:protein-S-isoprenylcysteine O-methyltransferase Ste14
MINRSKLKENKEKINIEEDKNPSLLKRFKNLLGVGPHLLLLGILLEGLTIFIRQWFSFYVPITFELQVILTVPCVTLCLLGMIWFNRSLDLIKVNLLDEKKKLITHGPFNYVRHPLYSTLMLTIPPMMIIWFSDFLFLIPWVLLFILSHYVVSLEERGLIETFGEEYKKYRRFVPSLLPYKGAGGKRYREFCDVSIQKAFINKTT